MAVAPLRYAGSPSVAGDWDIACRTTDAPAPRSPSATTKRLTLVATILGSSIAILDASVVSVALPLIQRSLGGGLAGEQWVTKAYLLTLGSFILLGGSLGDHFGERGGFALGGGGLGGACSRGEWPASGSRPCCAPSLRRSGPSSPSGPCRASPARC